MKMNNAKELQEFISSVRKNALDDVVKIIKSNAVNKDEAGFIMMYDCELIELINAIGTAKIKQQKEESDFGPDNLA